MKDNMLEANEFFDNVLREGQKTIRNDFDFVANVFEYEGLSMRKPVVKYVKDKFGPEAAKFFDRYGNFESLARTFCYYIITNHLLDEYDVVYNKKDRPKAKAVILDAYNNRLDEFIQFMEMMVNE